MSGQWHVSRDSHFARRVCVECQSSTECNGSLGACGSEHNQFKKFIDHSLAPAVSARVALRESIHSCTTGFTASATADFGVLGTFSIPREVPSAVNAGIVSFSNADSQHSADSRVACTPWPSDMFCRLAFRTSFSFSSCFLFLLVAVSRG